MQWYAVLWSDCLVSLCVRVFSPSGLFITIHDKGHLATMLNSWPEDDIKV